MAIALLCDSVNRRQAQPRAFAHCFRREEWFEDVRLCLLVHTYTGVGHLQQNEEIARYARFRLSVFFQAHVFRLDAQLSTVWHRVARVDDQIQN